MYWTGGGVLYMHYGFNQALEAGSSLGFLGMPMPELDGIAATYEVRGDANLKHQPCIAA